MVLKANWPLLPTAPVLAAYCLPGCRLVKTCLLEVVAMLIHPFSSVSGLLLIWCRKLAAPFGRLTEEIISPLLIPAVSFWLVGAAICLDSGCFLSIKPVVSNSALSDVCAIIRSASELSKASSAPRLLFFSATSCRPSPLEAARSVENFSCAVLIGGSRSCSVGKSVLPFIEDQMCDPRVSNSASLCDLKCRFNNPFVIMFG